MARSRINRINAERDAELATKAVVESFKNGQVDSDASDTYVSKESDLNRLVQDKETYDSILVEANKS